MAIKTKNREQVAKKKIKMSFPEKFVLLCSLLIVNCSFVLFAQSPGYFLDTSGEEPRFTQRLSWTGGEYASRYEVIIEKEEGGRYRELWREFTTASFIEVSLVPGRYRCYAIPYDFLGQPGERSEMYIEVLAALYPELDDTLVEFVYSDKDLVYEMNLSGKGLVHGADIYLRDSGNERIVPFAIYINENRTGARLSFHKDQLLPGNYELFIINPGGLGAYRGITIVVLESAILELPELPELAEQHELVYASAKKFNLFLGAAWMPLVTIYDKENRFSDDKWSPIGMVIRIGLVSSKSGIINLGAELTEAWSVFNDGSGRRAMYIDPTVNFLMQKRSPTGKTAFTFRLGIGFSLPLFSDNENRPPFTHLLHTNIGISLLVFVWNDIYLESGIDYAHWLSRPFSGNFRPWLGLGLRF
jgi:hypothetical protein